MPHASMVISMTWGELETVYDDLAITRQEKDSVQFLLTMTRLLSPHLSPLDLIREVICIAFVLSPANDRPPMDRLSVAVPWRSG